MRNGGILVSSQPPPPHVRAVWQVAANEQSHYTSLSLNTVYIF